MLFELIQSGLVSFFYHLPLKLLCRSCPIEYLVYREKFDIIVIVVYEISPLDFTKNYVFFSDILCARHLCVEMLFSYCANDFLGHHSALLQNYLFLVWNLCVSYVVCLIASLLLYMPFDSVQRIIVSIIYILLLLT